MPCYALMMLKWTVDRKVTDAGISELYHGYYQMQCTNPTGRNTVTDRYTYTGIRVYI